MRPCYRFLVHRLHSVSMSTCKCDVLEHTLTQPSYLHYRHLDPMFELGGVFGLCTAYTLCGDYRYTVLAKTKLPNWNLPTRIGDQSAKLNFHRIFWYVSCPELHLPRPQGWWSHRGYEGSKVPIKGTPFHVFSLRQIYAGSLHNRLFACFVRNILALIHAEHWH